MVTERVVQGARQVAGRYQVGEILGRGGMADVYLGTDARLGRRVAIKLLKPALATDPAFRTRFRQEAQAAARMAHPTIVRVFDAGEETVTAEDGSESQQPFIIMEYVEGRLLSELIAEGPLAPAEAVRVAVQVLTALEYSHRAGVVHRDVKPGNIMVTAAGQVKVMDFGIARAIADTAATVAQTSLIVGTAQYFSPEQARGESVDARTDLYSTGVVLFEMLTGRPPFRGDTPVAVAYQHVSETPVPPSAHNARVSPALDAVVLRALAKDRFERFQTAAEFRHDVEAAGAGQVPQRRPAEQHDFNSTLFGVNPNATATSDAAIRQLALTADERTLRPQSRPPVAWIWAGITLMAVIIAAVLFWTFNLAPTSLTGGVSVEVPDVAGQDYDTGVEALSAENLTAERIGELSDSVPEGEIIRTNPGPGINVSPEFPVKVYVSLGRNPVDVPRVGWMTEQEAIVAIQAAGLVYGSTSRENSPDVPAGVVIRTTPAGGETVREGESIDLVVSTGEVEVPNVIGEQLAAASALLNGTQYQLQVRPSGDWNCTGRAVTAQSLAPGNHPQNSEIVLTYCAG